MHPPKRTGLGLHPLITRPAGAIAAAGVALSLAACGGGGGGDSAGGGAAAAAPKDGDITLGEAEIGFPKPMFIGTPVPGAPLPNLEPPGDPVKELHVPAGTELLSLNKPVTSSDEFPTIGDLELVTDGDKDGGDGYYVELGPDTQWVQIDLEQQAVIEGIIVWHFHKQERVYLDVVVQISDDPEFATGVTTVYNSDHDNSAGLGAGGDMVYVETNHGRIIDVDGVTGRYIRLISNGNTADQLNHYVEVSVYGKPAA